MTEYADSVASDRVVLAGIDGSSVSQAVVDYACWIAKTVSAPLKLLHTIEHRHLPAVSDLSGTIGLGAREELMGELIDIEQNRGRLLIEKGELMLDAAEQRAHAAGVDEIEKCQRHGSLSESLIELEDKIRVLVLGIRGESHEPRQAGVGTQIESVIRAMHRPILVVNKSFSEPKNVMLAYDGSPSCIKALEMVASSPLFKAIACHIVHVGDMDKAQLDHAAETLIRAGLATQAVMLDGKSDEALAQYQVENAIDLMLMGAFSHHRMRNLLMGSFTAKMLAKTNKPLLLLR